MKYLFALIALLGALSASAENYFAVGKDSKVFDSPDATGYVTLNQNDEEVILIPGMVFKILETKNGWSMVEYSPGLRGYISEQARVVKSVSPTTGSYKVANSPEERVTITNAGNLWTVSSKEKTLSGRVFENVVIFFNEDNTPAYSLVDIGAGPVVINYDNSVTKFF